MFALTGKAGSSNSFDPGTSDLRVKDEGENPFLRFFNTFSCSRSLANQICKCEGETAEARRDEAKATFLIPRMRRKPS